MFKLLVVATLGSTLIASSVHAVVYCQSPGLPKGCVARPAAGVGVGAPGAGGVDPGINQPGAAGNVGARVATPGVGAPGAGGVDPGINQPGAAGNVGARRAADVGAPGAGVVDPGINQPGAAGNTGVRAKRVAPR